MIFLPILVFGLGLIIGSFLNVVILRLNTGRSLAKGRSQCARCSKTLHWYELVPVFSFLGLRGKCKACKEPISFQYPIVELLTGLVFTVIYTKIILTHGLSAFGIVTFLISIIIASLLIIIFAYDLRHKIIPSKIVIPFIIISLGTVFWRYFTVSPFMLASDLIAGPLMAAPFFFMWLLSKGKAMGFGDVRLSLGMGWFVGVSGSLIVFFLSFWIGAVVGLFLIASSKLRMKSEVPFAPFMIIAFFIVTIFGISISSLFNIWI